MKNAIETKDLTKYYGKSRGIVGVNLTIPQGDLFGFIGPNGAGKSTTIRTLLGLISPTGGSAEIFGEDIKVHRQELLKQIGYLPSEAIFYQGMRVRDVLQFSARLRKMDCSEEARRLCERLELDPGQKVRELSLGNRKKVGIVCAMQHRPPLYILDEPTGGLDPLIQREFYSLLQERNREGATVFLSSHILSEIQRYCRHAAVIRDGRLLACSSVEKLGHTGAKRVVLHGVTTAPRLEHMGSVQTEENSISFLYNGEPGPLLQELSRLPVSALTISEPDLEEVFLHYYEKEAAADDDSKA